MRSWETGRSLRPIWVNLHNRMSFLSNEKIETVEKRWLNC